MVLKLSLVLHEVAYRWKAKYWEIMQLWQLVTMVTKMTVIIMASSDVPREHTEEEGDIKGCKYTTQNTMEIRTL